MEPQRLWGIDLIAGLYAVGTLAVASLFWIGTPDSQVFAMVLAPSCAVLSLGIGLRINIVRKLLVVLLYAGLAVDIVLIMFYLAGMCDLVQLPPNKSNPLVQLGKIGVRLSLLVTILNYLQRPDVLAAFGVEAEPFDANDA